MASRILPVLAAICAALTGGVLLAPALPRPAQAQQTQLDLDAIFRCAASDAAGRQTCAAARELILQNCSACHTFVPIVMQQFDAAAWAALLTRHRPRVPQLSDAQIETIRGYLTDNFNPTKPPPRLPADLLKNWLPGAV